jgi:hypothetical protein
VRSTFIVVSLDYSRAQDTMLDGQEPVDVFLISPYMYIDSLQGSVMYSCDSVLGCESTKVVTYDHNRRSNCEYRRARPLATPPHMAQENFRAPVSHHGGPPALGL